MMTAVLTVGVTAERFTTGKTGMMLLLWVNVSSVTSEPEMDCSATL